MKSDLQLSKLFPNLVQNHSIINSCIYSFANHEMISFVQSFCNIAHIPPSPCKKMFSDLEKKFKFKKKSILLHAFCKELKNKCVTQVS